MKKKILSLFIPLIFLVAFLPSPYIYAQDIQEKSYLLESYVERYKTQVSENSRKYWVRNTPLIQNAVTVLKDLDARLETLQKKNIDTISWRNELENIVRDLKQVHESVKLYLEQAQKKHQRIIIEKRNSYTKISQLIHVRTERLISVISSRLVEKEDLSNTEKKIIQSLLDMRRYNEDLKNFYLQDFSSVEEVEEVFIEIIRNIRSELIRVKLLLK